jgi:hypothetical protein
MKKFFSAVICSSVFACYVSQTTESFSRNIENFNDQARIDTAIDLIKVACATGEKLDIETTGDGGISFLKRGVSAEVKFSKKEINGVVESTNQSLAREENREIRECMKQYVPIILGTLLGANTSVGQKQDSSSSTKEQKISVNIPTPVLDGHVTITIDKISEHPVSRNKFAELSVATPKRSPYNITLISDKSSG